MERTFYKTTITIEVLSEYHIGGLSLVDVVHNMEHGDFSGQVKGEEVEELNGAEMAWHLIEQGSEPAFFQLDDDGNDLDAGNREYDGDKYGGEEP
jgi:hypothetical protein